MAMVIDTMIGLVNVKEEAEKLTDLPLLCVNTHGHVDHIGGNWSFDQAYMNLADLSVAEAAIALPDLQNAVKQFGIRYPEFLPIEDEQIFDLGGLELQAYYLPGHTSGEIVLLDRKDKILFSGEDRSSYRSPWPCGFLPQRILLLHYDRSSARYGRLSEQFPGV